jgi:hypothetical protein
LDSINLSKTSPSDPFEGSWDLVREGTNDGVGEEKYSRTHFVSATWVPLSPPEDFGKSIIRVLG